MMATVDRIPVVDFQRYSEGGGKDDPVVRALHEAFTTVGFVFLTNTGIDPMLTKRAFDAGKEFFTLPVSVKSKYARSSSTNNDGYVSMEIESIDSSRPGDLKEAYNISKSCHMYPDKEAPSFRSAVLELYDACSTLAFRILETMGQAMELQDPQFFVKAHKGLGSETNFTTLRLLHYPPLSPDTVIKPGQLRCGEHVDYGSITLLFQDPSGGLQVKRCSGGYIDAPYIPNAVLVNLGALMQHWTADTYLATPHRVLIPSDEVKRLSVRSSLAFFCHPDNEVLVECLDGSNKYIPVTAYDDLKRRLNKTYEAQI